MKLETTLALARRGLRPPLTAEVVLALEEALARERRAGRAHIDCRAGEGGAP